MAKSILTKEQKCFLDLFSANRQVSAGFHLTGGTALNEYYLPYRYSEDLDFFSEEEVDTESITTFIRSIKSKLGYHTFELNTTFNRNIISLNFEETVLKLEFTYFPFPPIDTPKIVDGLKIDSLLDIAVNKLFTIYQKPRSRDFMDLYMINQKYGFGMEELIKKAKIKFDWHIDPLKLGSQFLQAKELKDYPRLIEPIDHRQWQEHFEKEAEKLGTQILSSV